MNNGDDELFSFSVCKDPTSNLTHIQEVSDWILKAKLPLSPPELKKKLEELKNLAANLPNSAAVLKEAEPQLETARKLLEEARDARWVFTLQDWTPVIDVHAVLSSRTNSQKLLTRA